ncbi:MAG: ABC transporter permease [Alkalispirochaetaceae bacterium]
MTQEISFLGLVTIYALLLLPLALFAFLKLPLLKDTAIAVLRMTAQLALVGLYIELLFALNRWWLSGLWLLLMLLVANGATLRRAGQKGLALFPHGLVSLALGTLIPLSGMLLLAVRPDPLYDARYLIPLAGMLVGNSLRANIIALERFLSSLRERFDEYLAALSLGASRTEALLPNIRSALNAALSPTIASIATIGLVSLPGMMTGQILGGSAPMTAITYQVAIMIAILVSTTITSSLNLYLTIRTAFDTYDIPRRPLLEQQTTLQR